MNNVGRYSYPDNDQTYTNDDAYFTNQNIEFSGFNILGMNPNPPQRKQFVLGRFIFKNCNANDVTIDAQNKMYIQYIDAWGQNQNPIVVSNFIGKSGGITVSTQQKIFYFGYISTSIVQQGNTNWDFWPFYTIDIGPQQFQSNIVDIWTVDILDQVYYDSFEGQWPGDWTVVDNQQAGTHYKWDRVSWARAQGQSLCIWCAGLDQDDNYRDPNQNNPWLLYGDNQDTYFYNTGNFRYIGLRICWDRWQQFDNNNNNDKLMVKTSDGTNFIQICTYDWNSNTQVPGLRGPNGQMWAQGWGAMPNSGYETGENTFIAFYFVSDGQNPVETGIFIDEFWLDTGIRQ